MHNNKPYSFEKTDVRGRFLLNFSCTKVQSKDVSPIAGNGKILAKGGIVLLMAISSTMMNEPLMLIVSRLPAFCQYIVSCRFLSAYNLTK